MDDPMWVNIPYIQEDLGTIKLEPTTWVLLVDTPWKLNMDIDKGLEEVFQISLWPYLPFGPPAVEISGVKKNLNRQTSSTILDLSFKEFSNMENSKTLPTDPWSIPQTPNQQFMKEFLSFGGLGMPGVCSRGMLGFP